MTNTCIRGDEIPQERPEEFTGPEQRVNTHKYRKKGSKPIINLRPRAQKIHSKSEGFRESCIGKN